MIEEPMNLLEQISKDPNYLMILAGAIIWFLGYYVIIIGGLFISTGFVLVCFATALNSVKRAVDAAWPGLLLGGLIEVIGLYLKNFPYIGNILIVVGGVVIMYFTIPLAIQRGELPIITQLQKMIDAQKKSSKKKKEKKESSESPDEEESEQ